MDIQMTSRDLELTTAIEDYGRDRFTAALDQHEKWIKRVEVFLRDVNGPRGGVDQQCNVAVTLNNGHVIRIDETGADVYDTMSGAATRLKQTAGREIGKIKDKQSGAL